MSQQINLFNPRFRKEKRYLTAPYLAFMLLGALFGSVAFAVAAHGRAAAAQEQADELKAQVQEAETRKQATVAGLVPRTKDVTVDQQLAAAEQEGHALRGVADIIGRNRVGDPRGYADYFEALARSRVAGLWLTGVQIAGGQGDIGLRGRALRAELLPGYLNGLAREPVLQGKAFGQVEIARPAPVTLPVPASAGADTPPPAPVTVTPPYVEFSLQAGGARPAGGAP
ncbi:hypothetical protein IP91_00509 [Pseudoduganella lurida]|uniref:MSHA biogenesis protein MshA n=1 Tax=Pseudoduganella lurida TaxID=1036180 RepID=A0A562RKA3_9BURK|nr:hypothetical protein [Pseudoduganella lurida]TWI69441.1 hypothetical protein IP91_00509 [Pseudoduganella lurida]